MKIENLLSLSLMVCCASGCAKDDPASSARPTRQFPVEVVKVGARQVHYLIQAVGSLEAQDRVQITARVAGVVERLRFREGDRVPAGQSLAEIDPDRYRIAVAAARAALERATANAADAKAALTRREGADAETPGLISKEEVESTRTRVSVAEAEVSQARAALRQAELNLRDAFVKSSMAGVIETRSVDTGQYVQPGTVLATLVKRDPLLLRFQVPEGEASQLVPGMIARFRTRDEERDHEATITHVAQTAATASRMVPILAQVVVGGKDDTLRPGAFAEITVAVGNANDAPVIPQMAIRPTEKGFVAFVVEGQGQGMVARERIINLGMRTADGMVEVRAGLKAGELLVVRGAEALTDGALVQIGAAPGETVRLTEACIKKPVLAWMLMAATVVFGAVAASRIGISQFPDVDFPTISVSVSLESAAPEVMEREVVEPIEEAVMQVEGIRKITSNAREGTGSVTLELELSRNVDVALQDVQAKVAQAQRRLPRDVDPPIVSKTNPEDQPIMWIGLSGPYSPQVLADTARYVVKERLQTVPGVGEVTMGGSFERNVRIWIDANQLDAKNLTVRDVLDALSREHVELPAGRLETAGREISVRVLGEALDLETLRHIVIKDLAGAPIYLSDVALVEDGFDDTQRVSRVDGVSAQGLGIRKQRGSNAVAVAKGVRAAIAEMKKTLPAGMALGINNDATRFIEESVHEIEWELLLAVVLTGLVCWLFLGSLSSTLNVVLAIPMSLLGTVAIIYFLGFTLNTFTLLALALSVGIVVDDAIMVLENIVRHAESGKDRVRAAREGTAEITFAAMAATLAVVAIFTPVIFMDGVIGRFFLQFGVTLSIAVLLSYLEAVTLAPARCSQILSTSREARGRVGRTVDQLFSKLARSYESLLARSLRRPFWVLGGAALVFAAALWVLSSLGTEFVPSQDQSRILVRLQTPVGSSLAETDRAFQLAERFVDKRPEVSRIFVVVGGGPGANGRNTGVMFLTLLPPDQRELTQAEFSAVLRKEFNSYPGVRAVVQDLSQAGFTAQRGFPVELSVQGPDWNELVTLSTSLMDKLRESGTVVDLDTNYDVGMPELRVIPDRARCADLGVSSEEVATTLNALVGGIRAGKYSTGGRRVDVRVKLLADQRQRPEDIGNLKVRTSSGALVPLSSLVRTEERPALQAVTRSDRQRAIGVFANIAPGHTQGEALKIVEELAQTLPTGYRVVLGGASVAFQESMGGLLFAVVLGILVAYMILASQFNSFLDPITVLTILPLSVAGAAFALFLGGHTLNIFSMIGILLLLGIVKKNSIILVDYANEERHRSQVDAQTAMLRAGPIRMRPILMTSVATLMAALPAALALGPGSEIRAPMAVAVIGGLVVSTALSLLVVPAFYVVAARARDRLRAGRRSPPRSS